MSTTVNELVAARNAAIERGDKALGRELYHQLQQLGFDGEDIDAGRVGTAAAAAVDAPETTEAPEAPEKAVKPEPRGKAAK